MQSDRDPASHPASTDEVDAGSHGLPGGGVTVEEMSEDSFPASDPPATWTWEIEETAADTAGVPGLRPS